MKVLHLLPSLEFGPPLRRLFLLLRQPNNDQTVVAALGTPFLGQPALPTRELHFLHRRRWFDPAPLFRLRRLLRETRPDIVHAWSLGSLRAVALVDRGLLPRTLTEVDIPPTWPDRRLLRRCAGAVVRTGWAGRQLLAAGVPRDRLRPIPPCPTLPLTEDNPLPATDLPPRYLIGMGRWDGPHRFRDAVWALDMLAYSHPDLNLVLVGNGPLEGPLRRLARSVHNRHRTVFAAGDPRNLAALYRAEQCWITAQPGRGLQTALDAQAAGCPVIAYDQPALRELVEPDGTAFLIPPGDLLALARRTHALLTDADLRQETAARCRAFVLTRFPAAAALAATAGAYRRAG